MKSIIHFFLFSLLIWLPFSPAQAQNTVYGLGAGTGGDYNTHIGTYAGKASTAYGNTFIGYSSGVSNVTGHSNIFLGYYSGYINISGNSNTFLGYMSGFRNTTGSSNTFLGYYSGKNNTTGHSNVFLGYLSGEQNTTGSYNIFLGNSSGRYNITGFNNTFLGYYSGYNNTTGNSNTFLGFYSGHSNTTGNSNTSLGFLSGYSNTSGEKNVFIGYQAGYSETGSNKLYIDNNDDNNPLLYGNFDSNTLSVGTKYTGNTYQLVIPGSIRSGRYDVISDERLKENVHELADVLAKVQQVKGVSYVLKEESNAKGIGNQQDKAMQYGFLAQNIQQVFPELVTEEEGLLAVNYQGMIPVMVEALKELTLQKDSVMAVNIAIAQQIMALNQRLDAVEKAVGSEKTPFSGSIHGTEYWLAQNHPNPFDQSTTIRYQVSEEAQQVGLLVTNLQGVEVQRFNQLPAGTGEVQITAGSLTPGTYVCILFADGLPISSQRMLLTR